MNRNEFIDEMYKLGFKVEKIHRFGKCPELEVVQNDKFILYVSELHLYKFNLDNNFEKLNDYIKERVYKTVVTYAATPIEEREDRKFYLRLKGISDNSSYLNKGKYESEDYIFNSKEEKGMYQTVFTPKDIRELPSGLLEAYSCGNLYVEHI